MRILNAIPIFLIQLYRFCLSPLLPPSCRFTPTCSMYALMAFRKFNILKASWLTLRRLLKCHPFHNGGYDPLP